MKKLFFIVIASASLFCSCNNDNDLLTTPTVDTKEYQVNLEIKSNTFDLNKTPLTKNIDVDSTTYTQISQMRIIAYKESGEFVKDTIINSKDSQILIDASNTSNNTLKASIYLPVGKYILALIGDRISDNYFSPKNFNTDYYERTTNPTKTVAKLGNIGMFYESMSVTVNATSENNTIATQSISLKPMWSKVKVVLKGLLTAKIPANTDWIRPVYQTHYYGFGLKSKLANKTIIWGYENNSSDLNRYSIPRSNIDMGSSIYFVGKGENTNMGLNFQFLQGVENSNDITILNSKLINFDTKYQFDNGYNYTITCDMVKVLGDAGNNPSLNITVDQSIIDPNNHDNDINLEF